MINMTSARSAPATRRQWAVRLLAAAAAAVGCIQPTAAQKPANQLPLVFGYAPSAPLPMFYVANGLKLFEEAGVAMRVENMADTPFLLDMLHSRKIDLSGGATATVVQRRALGAPVKIVAAFGYSFTDKSGRSWESVRLVAPKARNIATVAELKGKKVAVVAFGSTWDIVVRERLKDAGINPKDVTILAMPFTQMAAALSTGEIDAAAITAAEFARAAKTIPMTTLMSASQLTGVKIDVTQFVVARDDWLAENEEVTVRFLKALMKAHLWMANDITKNDGVNVKRMIKEQLKYDDLLTDATYEHRVGLEARLAEMANPLDVPKSTIDGYNKILVTGGLLRGKPPATYDDLVDRKYLRRVYKELGLTWDDSKTE
jgi:ABC-type nitrate/sulfonate/bicarbonate transport system substrate-binding protein